MIVTLNSCREGYRRTDSAKRKERLCFALDETAAVFRDDRTVPRLITVIGAVIMQRDQLSTRRLSREGAARSIGARTRWTRGSANKRKEEKRVATEEETRGRGGREKSTWKSTKSGRR